MNEDKIDFDQPDDRPVDSTRLDTVIVAIISDTHDVLNEQVANIIRRCDIAIHAGDIGNAEVLDAMQPKSGEVVAVAGNNDHPRGWPPHQEERVKQLPRIASLHLPGGLLRVEHGHIHDMIKPDHEDLRRAHPEARMVVYGHTHKKIIDDFALPWVVNPGAAGATRTRGGASCMVLNASESLWTLESYRFEDESKTNQAAINAA